MGRDEIRALLQRPNALRIALTARWTLNAFAAGFSYAIDKNGMVSAEPREGVYRCLMEGLESFAALMRAGITENRHGRANVQRTPAGQTYISALPGKTAIAPSKDDWASGDDYDDRFVARR